MLVICLDHYLLPFEERSRKRGDTFLSSTKKTTRSLFKKDIRELWQHFVEHLECRDIDESDMVLSLPHLIKQVQLLLTSCTTLQTLEFRYERKVTVKFLSTLVMKKKENKSVRAN